jgi:hypothetical protein
MHMVNAKWTRLAAAVALCVSATSESAQTAPGPGYATAYSRRDTELVCCSCEVKVAPSDRTVYPSSTAFGCARIVVRSGQHR